MNVTDILGLSRCAYGFALGVAAKVVYLRYGKYLFSNTAIEAAAVALALCFVALTYESRVVPACSPCLLCRHSGVRARSRSDVASHEETVLPVARKVVIHHLYVSLHCRDRHLSAGIVVALGRLLESFPLLWRPGPCHRRRRTAQRDYRGSCLSDDRRSVGVGFASRRRGATQEAGVRDGEADAASMQGKRS